MKPNRLDGKIFALGLAVVSLGICYGAICDTSSLERSPGADPVADGSVDASIAALWDLNASNAFNISEVGTGDAALLAGDVRVPLALMAPDLAYQPVYSLGRPVMAAQFLSTVPDGSVETAMDTASGSPADDVRTASDGQGDPNSQAGLDSSAQAPSQEKTDSAVFVPASASSAPSAAGGSPYAPPLTAGYEPTGVQMLSGSFYAPAQAAQAEARIAGTVPASNESSSATSVSQPTTAAATAASTPVAIDPAPAAPLIGNLSGTLISEVNPASSDFGGTLSGAFVKTTELTTDVGSTVTPVAAPVVDVAASLPVANAFTTNISIALVPDTTGTWALLGIGLACIAPFALRRRVRTGSERSR